MEVDSNNKEEIAGKLEKVLHGLLAQGFKTVDGVYLEMLISHLSGKHGEDYTYLIKSPIISDWICKSIAYIDTEDHHNSQLCSFTLHLMAILFGNEWQFMNLIETDIILRLKNVIYQYPEIRTPSVKLAHVLLLKEILRHSIGTVWIKKNESWKLVIDYCMENQTVYVVRESQDFVTDFIFKVVSVLGNDELCIELLTKILEPVTKAIVIENSVVIVDSVDLQNQVTPTIELLCHILNRSIQSNIKTSIPNILHDTFCTEIKLWRLTDMTKDQHFFQKIMQAQVYLNHSQLANKLSDNSATSLDFNKFGLTFFNQMKFCIVNRNAMALLSITKLYHILWNALGSRAPDEIELENNKINFENQIIILQLMPILCSIGRACSKTQIFDDYIMKLFNISTEHTLRVCYALRDLLIINKPSIADVAAKSIQGILSMKKILNRERAIYVFQALTYTLKDFSLPESDEDAQKKAENCDKLIEMPNLLSAILSGLYELVKEYKITWKDSLESVCLLNFMLSMLNTPNLSSRLAVQALKLTQLSIEHFLAPNLALLVSNLKGSGMENLGPTVMKRLHDPSWEVRDSTLELLTSMSSIAIFKFPAFQQLFIENEICPVILSLAKNDSESFVKASALNCLCPMVTVQQFWDTCLASMDLVTHLLHVLRTESEGIVRKEAANLIRFIYKHQKIPAQQMDMVFSTLSFCATNDLYWEVKISALEFWKVVLKRQFQLHGVIDGAFPAVTFSKQQKKIVTLTPKEITNRLTTILNELSYRGCLGVLLECLNDTSDLEVVKLTVVIIQKINLFLNKYNYRTETLMTNSGAAPSSVNKPLISPIELNDIDLYGDGNVDITESNDIIDSIISSNDINLLASAYENKLNFENADSFHTIDEHYFKKFTHITAEVFIHRVDSMDLEGLIQSRADWIKKTESFDSLLDDVLLWLEMQHTSNIDCY